VFEDMVRQLRINEFGRRRDPAMRKKSRKCVVI
jgi:hypothetical protein